MLRTWRRPQKLFGDFNTLQFASVMGIVVFVILLVFMTIPPHHPGTSVDLPKVFHPISMPNAQREDAMKVSVTRDGKVYFGTDQVDLISLQRKIAERLQDHSIERKVYVSADMRARWGAVKQALDGIRAAGILRVAFLTIQRKS
jgi:biopolymer transport protein TolR